MEHKIAHFHFIKVFISSIFFIVISFLGVKTANAAIITLDPVTSAVPVGQRFTVLVSIDTEGEKVTSTDVILKFNSTYLSVVSVVKGNNGQLPFFPDFFQNVAPSEVYLGAAVSQTSEAKTGTGVIGTITFQGKTVGVTDVMFDCTPGKTSDSNINKSDVNVTDIIDCSRLVNGKYTIGSGIETSPTTTITATPIVGSTAPLTTPTPQPTLIVSGTYETTIAIVGIATLLFTASLGSFIFLKSW